MTPLLGLLLAAFPHASPEPFLALEAGSWRGGGYARSDDGRFSHCAAERDGSGRISLAIDARYELVVSLAVAAGDDPGPFPARVLVDAAWLGSFTTTRSAGALHVRFGRRPDVYARLRAGAALEVGAPEGRVRAALAGADSALERVRECVDLARSFTSGRDNPYLPGNDPVYAPAPSSGDRARFDVRGKVGALLRAAGLDRIEFNDTDRLGAAGTQLAWTSGELLGFASLETRSERSTEELEGHYRQLLGIGCTEPATLRARPPSELGGYTLHQAVIACPVEGGLRISVTTSILDSADIVSLVHMGLDPQAARLDELNGSLGRLLEVLLRR